MTFLKHTHERADIPMFVCYKKVPFYDLMAKLKGIAHEYASVIKHPYVCAMVSADW